MTKPYHIPVLVNEVLEYLNPQPGKLYIDATFGGGSHTRAILDAQPECKVLALDWDQNALDIHAPKMEELYGDRFSCLYGTFSHITQLLKKDKISSVDGILADFGTSQFQISNQAGFSFNVPTPLDMRMSPGHFRITAADIVNKATEEELAHIFFEYGEENASRKIARLIVNERKINRIVTTQDLAQLVMKIIKPYSRSIHPATKVFQALRIFVNDELNNINALLAQSIPLLNPQGRIVCISFHSLEDRIVKNFFRDHKTELTTLTKKVVIGTDEEIARNPSSRSAKLRAAEKI